MALFVGEFDQTIDAVKHRLAIPTALREQIVSDEDWDIAQHVLDTFVVVGDLP